MSLAFEKELKEADNLEEFMSVINKCPLQMINSKDQKINKQKLLNDIRALSTELDVMETVSSLLPGNPITEFMLKDTEITPNYGLREKFIELVKKKYQEELARAQQPQAPAKPEVSRQETQGQATTFEKELKAANNIDEFMSVINTCPFEMKTNNGMTIDKQKLFKDISDFSTELDTMKVVSGPYHLAEYLLKNTQITPNYGLREKFIELVKKKYQEELARAQQVQAPAKPEVSRQEIQGQATAFEKELKAADNLEEFISVINKCPFEMKTKNGTTIDKQMLFKNIGDFSTELEMMKVVSELPPGTATVLAFQQTAITSNYGLREKFIELVKKKYQEELARVQQPQATTKPEVFRQDTPRQDTPRQDTPRQEAPRQEAPRQEAPRQEAPRQEAPRQEAPRQDSQIQAVLRLNHNDIQKKYNEYHHNSTIRETSKKGPNWIFNHAKSVGGKISGKGKERERQLRDISKLFTELNTDESSRKFNGSDKAEIVYVFLENIKNEIGKEKLNSFDSGLVKLCNDLQQQIKSEALPKEGKMVDSVYKEAQTRIQEILGKNNPVQDKKTNKKP